MAAPAGTILRIRGLPYSATEQDLKDFFNEYSVVAIHLSQRNGKPTGEAYVQFETAEQASEALKKRNHEHLGNRYLELFEALEAGLVARGLGPGGSAAAPSLQGHVVRLRGLPFASSAQDVLAFFQGIEVVGGEAGVIFTCTPDGRPAGEAYVELASPDDKQAALAKHKEKIGSRYIEIFDSSKGDMYQAVQQHGCFTAVGGKRRHHWPAGGGGGAPHAAQQSGGGQFGEVGPGRGPRGPGGQHEMEQMAAAFAGFGISPHDIQVPGPPRGTFMPFGVPPSDDSRQYGARPGPQGPMGGMPTHWRPPTQPAPGPNHPGARPPQFSRAPGPPTGKGGNGGGGGSRQQGGGLFEYGATPPLMMQAPFMLQPPPFMHPQQPGSPWAAAMMASAQQGGGWYGAGMPGPSGRGGMPMGMAGPYTAYGPGYYVRSPGMSPQHMGPGGGTPPGTMALGTLHAYPRTPPPAGPGGGGGSNAHHMPQQHHPQQQQHHQHQHAQHTQHAPPAPSPLGAGSMPVPVPAPVRLGAGPEEVAGPPSGGIGGRGDSSHSLTGLMHSPAAASRPESSEPSEPLP